MNGKVEAKGTVTNPVYEHVLVEGAECCGAYVIYGDDSGIVWIRREDCPEHRDVK